VCYYVKFDLFVVYNLLLISFSGCLLYANTKLLAHTVFPVCLFVMIFSVIFASKKVWYNSGLINGCDGTEQSILPGVTI